MKYQNSNQNQLSRNRHEVHYVAFIFVCSTFTFITVPRIPHVNNAQDESNNRQQSQTQFNNTYIVCDTLECFLYQQVKVKFPYSMFSLSMHVIQRTFSILVNLTYTHFFIFYFKTQPNVLKEL